MRRQGNEGKRMIVMDVPGKRRKGILMQRWMKSIMHELHGDTASKHRPHIKVLMMIYLVQQ